MSNVKLLILFNIIIIFLSYKFNKHIMIIYPFVFILLITLYLQLYYKKKIEGFIDDNERGEEIFSVWDSLDQDTYEEGNNIILDKINQLLKMLIDVEKNIEKKYYDEKCEGEFIVDEAKKDCGYNVYDEKTYKITKQGYDCDHRAGHKERIFKPLCRLNEKCRKDRDCERGKCVNGECKIDFECNSNKLNNCDEDGCDKLNENVGYNKYKFTDGRCRIDSCNIKQYDNCDEEGCNDLRDYRFMWDKNDKACIRKDLEVTKCSQYNCPTGYSNINDEFECRKKLTREEVQEREGDTDLGEGDVSGYLDMCSRNVCCKENYTCERYYAPDGRDLKNCDSCNDGGDCEPECFHGDTIHTYEYYDPSDSEYKKQYYPYKDNKNEGDTFPDESKYCLDFECDKEECLEPAPECSDFDGKEEECDGTEGCNYCLGNCFSGSELPDDCPTSCSGVPPDNDNNCKYAYCKYCPESEKCYNASNEGECPSPPPSCEERSKEQCYNASLPAPGERPDQRGNLTYTLGDCAVGNDGACRKICTPESYRTDTCGSDCVYLGFEDWPMASNGNGSNEFRAPRSCFDPRSDISNPRFIKPNVFCEFSSSPWFPNLIGDPWCNT